MFPHRRHHKPGHRHGPPPGARLMGAMALHNAHKKKHHSHHHSHVAEKVAAGVVIGAALGAGAAVVASSSSGSGNQKKNKSSECSDSGGYYGETYQSGSGYYGQPERQVQGYYGSQPVVVAEPVPVVEPVVEIQPQSQGYYGAQPVAAPVVVAEPVAPVEPVVVQPPGDPFQSASQGYYGSQAATQPAYNPQADLSASSVSTSPQTEGQPSTAAVAVAVVASAPLQPAYAQPVSQPVATQPVNPYYQQPVSSQPAQQPGMTGFTSSGVGATAPTTAPTTATATAPLYPSLPVKAVVQKAEEKKGDVQAPKGTIVAQYPYNQSHAEEDARRLRAAFKGFGCDKRVVVEITGSRSHIQRMMIKRAYERNLLKDLQGELGGELRKLVMLLYAAKGAPEAKWMKEAFSGAGYNTSLLNETLLTKTNAELKEMKSAWRTMNPREELMKRLSSETSKRFSAGHYKDLCCRILEANRPENVVVDSVKVRQDAEMLNRMLFQAKSSEAKTKFVQVFSTRSWAHLAAVANVFQEISKKFTLCAAVKEKLGDSDTSQAIRTITSYVLNPYDYWARRLQEAMKGLGTDDCKLRRVIVSRCEKDLDEVIKVFGQRYGKGKTLKSWIESDTDGEYRRLLLKLCGY